MRDYAWMLTTLIWVFPLLLPLMSTAWPPLVPLQAPFRGRSSIHLKHPYLNYFEFLFQKYFSRSLLPIWNARASFDPKCKNLNYRNGWKLIRDQRCTALGALQLHSAFFSSGGNGQRQHRDFSSLQRSSGEAFREGAGGRSAASSAFWAAPAPSILSRQKWLLLESAVG